MARIKQAVSIVRAAIDKMRFREEYYTIVGMMEMAVRLDKMTFEEKRELTDALDDKYETLDS
jgi:hypothetical protein